MPVIAGSVFVWLGMVLGISFLEAPLKFRAPGVTVQIGLGIGRIVFRALNIAEAALAATAVIAALISETPAPVLAALATAVVILLIQLAAIRPVLNKRSNRVLAGETGNRSHAHLYYVAAEALKVAALVGTGVLALS
jgi:hypothetical protein